MTILCQRPNKQRLPDRSERRWPSQAGTRRRECAGPLGWSQSAIYCASSQGQARNIAPLREWGFGAGRVHARVPRETFRHGMTGRVRTDPGATGKTSRPPARQRPFARSCRVPLGFESATCGNPRRGYGGGRLSIRCMVRGAGPGSAEASHPLYPQAVDGVGRLWAGHPPLRQSLGTAVSGARSPQGSAASRVHGGS